MKTVELRVTLRWLGLDPAAAAALLGVDRRSVRRWLDGAQKVPDGVAGEVDGWRRDAAETALRLVVELDPLPVSERTVQVFARDEDFWAAYPDREPLPVDWWDQIASRVATVSGARLVWP